MRTRLHLAVRAGAALVALTTLAGCGVGSRDLGTGGFQDTVYVHDGLGLRVPFPADWNIMPPEVLEELARSGREVMSGGDPTGGNFRGESTSETLFQVYRHPRGSVQGVNPNLVGGLENVVSRPQIQTAVDYLQMLQSFMSRGQVPMKFEPIVPESELGGQTWAVMAATLQFGNTRVGQVFHARRVDDHILTLVATFATPEQWAEIEVILGSLTLES